MNWREWFKRYAAYIVNHECTLSFTVESLYQAFKARYEEESKTGPYPDCEYELQTKEIKPELVPCKLCGESVKKERYECKRQVQLKPYYYYYYCSNDECSMHLPCLTEEEWNKLNG